MEQKRFFFSLTTVLAVLITVVVLANSNRPWLAVGLNYTPGEKGGIIATESLLKSASRNLQPMVLSYSLWEQTANALDSLMSLQCWAKNIGKVVEPSIVPHSSSAFQLPSVDPSLLKFSDLFDLNYWNTVSTMHSISTLTPIEDFLQNAVKQVVYVHIKYKWSPVPCKELQSFMEDKGFRVIKSVCIDFVRSPIINEKKFEEQIFQDIGRNVTLLFSEWRGIRSKTRVSLEGENCKNLSRINAFVSLSDSKPAAVVSYSPLHPRIAAAPSQQVTKYVDKFLSEYLSGDPYIAIMLRTETIKTLDSSCEQKIYSDWKTMVNSTNITKTLLFTDTGEHGSATWGNKAAERFSQHIGTKTNVHLLPNKMNSVLEGIINSKNSVLIAVLHQQLMAHATCVVKVGEGSFHKQALNQYALRHKGQLCYAIRTGQCKDRYITHVQGESL